MNTSSHEVERTNQEKKPPSEGSAAIVPVGRLTNQSQRPHPSSPPPRHHGPECLDLSMAVRLDLDALMDAHYSLDQIREALDDLDGNRITRGVIHFADGAAAARRSADRPAR